MHNMNHSRAAELLPPLLFAPLAVIKPAIARSPVPAGRGAGFDPRSVIGCASGADAFFAHPSTRSERRWKPGTPSPLSKKIAPSSLRHCGSYGLAQTTPRQKLRLARYPCFALALHQPKFPGKIHGLSAVV
jgi:hypothetical protein